MWLLPRVTPETVRRNLRRGYALLQEKIARSVARDLISRKIYRRGWRSHHVGVIIFASRMSSLESAVTMQDLMRYRLINLHADK